MVPHLRTAGLALALGLGLTATGCIAHVRGNATATAEVPPPNLVLVEGDVWVVEDYDEPVFYTEGFYWRYMGGVWYRSEVHHANWVRVTVVPASVQRIDQPTRYVHYAAPVGAEKRVGPPDHAPAHGVHGTQPGHHHDDDQGGPPEHAGPGVPPGHGGTPPGHGGTPPGHGGTPPGHGGAGTPPGHVAPSGPPPGHAGYKDQEKDKGGGRPDHVAGPGPGLDKGKPEKEKGPDKAGGPSGGPKADKGGDKGGGEKGKGGAKNK